VLVERAVAARSTPARATAEPTTAAKQATAPEPVAGGRPNVYDLAGRSVLDLGCGMGLTGTVCAALGANVLFADLETSPLLFARLNSLPWAARVRARRLNWQTDRLGERFDLIVGADILYERNQWEFLDAFWRLHLAPGGELVLGEPGRQSGDTFLEWAPARGWALDRVDRKVPTRETPVRVLRLALR
jgi:2-polyprenyl-3-methyl-5-hydroxy-6-metoxy-1,4-benzoquinol methylase